VVNLLMGFAMAVLFGHGPQRWPHLGLVTWRRFWRRRPPAAVSPAQAAPATACETLPAAVASPAVPTNAKELAPTPEAHCAPAQVPAKPATPVAKPAAASPGLAAPPDEFGDLNWALPLDAVLAQLHSEVQAARGQLAALAEKACRCSVSPSQEEIAACLGQLQEVGRHYLGQQEGALAMLDDTLASEGEEHADLGESVRQAAQQQSDSLRCALAELAQWPPAGQSLDKRSQHLLAQTQQILAACDCVGQCVGSAAAQLQQRQSSTPTATSEPPITASAAPVSPGPTTNFVHPVVSPEEPAREVAVRKDEAHDEVTPATAGTLDEEALYAAVARTLADFGGLRDELPATPQLATSTTN
jgi:hypothetical protein